MQIKLASVFVDDQAKAQAFYTTVLGFVTKADIAMGPCRWLTVSSPDGVDGMELLLEPLEFPPAAVYQKALFDAGIACTNFYTEDIAADFARLSALGVKFRGVPATMGPATTVLFEDTCGNLIHLVQING
jgi:catechol 2,3-dioxygenase-like lactoylglutathione lyase family enzyme